MSNNKNEIRPLTIIPKQKPKYTLKHRWCRANGEESK